MAANWCVCVCVCVVTEMQVLWQRRRVDRLLRQVVSNVLPLSVRPRQRRPRSVLRHVPVFTLAPSASVPITF